MEQWNSGGTDNNYITTYNNIHYIYLFHCSICSTQHIASRAHTRPRTHGYNLRSQEWISFLVYLSVVKIVEQWNRYVQDAFTNNLMSFF